MRSLRACLDYPKGQSSVKLPPLQVFDILLQANSAWEIAIIGIFGVGMNLFRAKMLIEEKMNSFAGKIPINPNWITFFSLISMATAAYLLFKGNLLGAGFLILLSGFLDLLDGTVAKAKKKATKLGAFFDRVSDKAADLIIISSAILGFHVDVAIGIFVLFTVAMASTISFCLEAIAKTKVADRFSMRGLRLLILAFGCFFNQLYVAMLMLAFLGSYAIITRLAFAVKILK